MLTVCLLVMMMHEKSSNAFMGARPLMDRAHEYDRLDEAFLADLRLICPEDHKSDITYIIG